MTLPLPGTVILAASFEAASSAGTPTFVPPAELATPGLTLGVVGLGTLILGALIAVRGRSKAAAGVGIPQARRAPATAAKHAIKSIFMMSLQ